VYEGWEKNNPIDMINDDIEGISTGFAVTSNINPNSQMQLNIDYTQLANAVVDGMTRSNLGIRIDNRDFGRIVREAVRYG
jgi:hypothetical protein